MHDANALLEHALVVLVDFSASHFLNVGAFAGAFNSSEGCCCVHNRLHSHHLRLMALIVLMKPVLSQYLTLGCSQTLTSSGYQARHGKT